jgi:hypothetical protein
VQDIRSSEKGTLYFEKISPFGGKQTIDLVAAVISKQSYTLGFLQHYTVPQFSEDGDSMDF